jgi:hypothetical protein
VHSRRTASSPVTRTLAAAPREVDRRPLPVDALDWSWPPYAPVEVDVEPFGTADWAPASVVWHPLVRVGRWTVVYRRAA